MENSKFFTPLVSAVVVTFNSSKYIVETLDSIKAQTYENIELIISDDCSKDVTVDICRNWIKENKSRFVRVELVESEKNTGIPANCNRGLNASKGEFLKFIAGDDIILPEFIKKCLTIFLKDEKVAVTYTNAFFINSESKIISKFPSKNFKSGYVFKELFFNQFWPAAASFFFRRNSVLKVGGFDETICVEDYLLILKLAKNYKIHFVIDYLTYYRIHDSNTSKDRFFIYQGHLKTINKFKDYEGYDKRIKQLKVSYIYDNTKINKRNALKLIYENLNTLSFKAIWLRIFFRLLLPKKFLTC